MLESILRWYCYHWHPRGYPTRIGCECPVCYRMQPVPWNPKEPVSEVRL